MLKRRQVCLSGVSESTDETITAAPAFVSLRNGNNELSSCCNDSVTELKVLKCDRPPLRDTKLKTRVEFPSTLLKVNS